MRADERAYYDLPEEALVRIGEQTFLDYAAVLAALSASARKRHLRAMVEHLGPDYILFV